MKDLRDRVQRLTVEQAIFYGATIQEAAIDLRAANEGLSARNAVKAVRIGGELAAGWSVHNHEPAIPYFRYAGLRRFSNDTPGLLQLEYAAD